MRLFGLLTEDGDVLYLYEDAEDLLNSQIEDDGFVSKGDQLIRIDAYTVLAVGDPGRTDKGTK